MGDAGTLTDIAAAARRIAEFTAGFSREAFLADPKTQSSVLHQLLTVGEAVKRLSPDFVASHPRQPWSDMAGMRDILIHAYDTVDLEEVWRTTNTDMPELLSYIEPLLATELDE